MILREKKLVLSYQYRCFQVRLSLEFDKKVIKFIVADGWWKVTHKLFFLMLDLLHTRWLNLNMSYTRRLELAFLTRIRKQMIAPFLGKIVLNIALQ